MPQTQGTVLENGLVTGQQDPDDCSGMKYGGKWLGNDGRGGTNKIGFTWGLENPEAGKDRRKIQRARRSAEKWFVHKETAERNQRRRLDYKVILEEWCKENGKAVPEVKVVQQIGGMSKAYVGIVTIGEETYEGPRALHEETSKRGAFTKALEVLGVSYAEPEPEVSAGSATAAKAAAGVMKDDGGFLARFKEMKRKQEEASAASNDAGSLGEKMRAGMSGMEQPDENAAEKKAGNRKRGR